jgi:hypothetical protein
MRPRTRPALAQSAPFSPARLRARASTLRASGHPSGTRHSTIGGETTGETTSTAGGIAPGEELAEGGAAVGGVTEGGGVAEGGVAKGGAADGGVAEGGAADGGVAEGGVADGDGGVADVAGVGDDGVEATGTGDASADAVGVAGLSIGCALAVDAAKNAANMKPWGAAPRLPREGPRARSVILRVWPRASSACKVNAVSLVAHAPGAQGGLCSNASRRCSSFTERLPRAVRVPSRLEGREPSCA